jgi:two-component system sensor histidine kinase/response regulator
MIRRRAEVTSAVARARADLDRARTNLDQAHARMESLAADDRQRAAFSAHAFNNYLLVVRTMSDLIQRKLTGTANRDVTRWLNVLKQETNRMAIIARGVLTGAPDGLLPLMPEPSSLTEIAESVCIVYRDRARQKRVRLTCKGPAIWDRVLTDRMAVGAVLDNLLSNAVKYSGSDTTIAVTTVIRHPEVVCSVTDHGPGIAAADLARLFQEGMPLSATPTGGESSTGYGLAIAKELSKALGGRLSCTSVLGEG